MSLRRAVSAALIGLVLLQLAPAPTLEVYKPPVRYLNTHPQPQHQQPPPRDDTSADTNAVNWRFVVGILKIIVGVGCLWGVLKKRSGVEE